MSQITTAEGLQVDGDRVVSTHSERGANMRGFVIVSCLLVMILVGAAPTSASPFLLTPLASSATDHQLLNPWGIAASGGSPFWIGSNGSGVSEIYNGAGIKQGLVVSIPGDGSVTGVVFSGVAGSFNGDLFLFNSQDGTISGWRGALGTTAETLQLPSPDNVYTGLAQATIGGNAYAYSANFHTARIDVLRGNSGAPFLTGSFTDPGLPSGYAPFNVQNLGGILYVTYAVRDGSSDDELSGAGHGIVDEFDLQGNFVRRLVTGGDLNSPWGLAMAPAGFGDVAGDLLVGNFGDGRIHAYDPLSGALIETLMDSSSNPIVIDGLWGLRFGNGTGSGSSTTLYFTAGPNNETEGLFGDLVAVGPGNGNPVPEPGTFILIGSGLAGAVLRRRRAAIQVDRK
jgi:uncharacterized protein (TIGR03118 family)